VTQTFLDAGLVVLDREEVTGREIVELASDSLIVSWFRLRDWINEDSEFLLVRERLRVARTEWERSHRDSSALAGRTLLDEVRRWLPERENDFTKTELEFVEASSALNDRLGRAMSGPHFISYAPTEALDFVLHLADVLAAGPPSIPVWLDKRALQPGRDWDEQLGEAIRDCASLLFVMTPDSVEDSSVCKAEWTRALRYKKPVVPIKLHRDADLPYRLGGRQFIDFTGPFEPALARLRQHLVWLASPAGALQVLQDRLVDAQRDLRRASGDVEAVRAQADILDLERQIAAQQTIIDDPQVAAARIEASITTGLERERRPARPVVGVTRSRFINPPPTVAPTHFQDRFTETALLGEFLRDEGVRLTTVVGRAGIGKTALVCRLLKSLEVGQLPDDGGPIEVDGIVYLSAIGTRRPDVPTILADLARLVSDDWAERLEALFSDPRATTRDKMQALLAELPSGRTILLLDNFEDMLDPETLNIRDPELDEALRTTLQAPHHGVKVVVTTRVAPRALALVEPGRQRRLDFDEGLGSPYAENILRALDADGKLGLKQAPDALLSEARERTRGYPRALEALVSILSADRGITLREVLNDTARLLPEHVVEVLVGEAFSRLDPVAQRVMQGLAIYGRPVAPVAVDYLLRPYVEGIDSGVVLGRLVGWQFARREAGRFYLHPVDRAYTLDRLPAGEPWDLEDDDPPSFTRAALRRRAAEYFLEIRLPHEEWKRLDDLAPQLAEFDLRCESGEYETAAEVLLEIDFDYLLLWGHAPLVADLHEQLRGRLTEPDIESQSLSSLGSSYSQMGRYNEAIGCLEQSLAISREVGDRVGEGVALDNLGICYQALGQVTRAIDLYEQSLAIAREIDNRRGEGTTLNNLGLCYGDLGQVTRASEYHEQALATVREVGDRGGEENALSGLGSCYQDLGEVTRAIEYHEQALAIAREVRDRNGEGMILYGLGICYWILGQVTRAIEHYEQVLAIVREIGDRGGERNALGGLGSCCQDLGQVTRAIGYYEQALAIAREVGSRGSEGNALWNLGTFHQDLGQVTRAIGYYEQALAITREVGDSLTEGLTLLDLARLSLTEGHTDQAAQQARESIKIADEIDNPRLRSLSHTTTAEIHLIAGDLPAARSALDIASQHDEPTSRHRTLMLLGLVALRQDDRPAARQAFEAAVRHADARLSHGDQLYESLDIKGLALYGLTLCGDDRLAEATEAVRAARTIISAPGVTREVARRFDALAQADSAGILATVRPVALGEQSSQA
jgi:tetratricopeptide (TPR) repeat protein